MCRIALLVLLVGIAPAACLAGTFAEAVHNFSSYEITVSEGFCPGATPVFIDALPNPDLGGVYFGWAVVMEPAKAPYILENVLLVAVKTTVHWNHTVAEVLEHECEHYRQRLEYPNYFAYLKAYNTSPLKFEAGAATVSELRRPFSVARLGKSREPPKNFVIHFR